MGFQRTRFMCELVVVVFTLLVSTTTSLLENPKFGEPIANITVPVGREAVFTCTVEDLGTYKVAWLRVDTQTILTIQNHLITKNSRFTVTHSENKTWYLHIRDVHEHDRGWYMCQLNTDPMKSQEAYLDVVVSPDILDYPTSTDMVVVEGSNASIRCEARGYPKPHITWKREGGEPFRLHGQRVSNTDGSVLSIDRVNRRDMGPYLCIASNGIPPSVSKRIMLIVNFPPNIYVANQLLGTYTGFQVILECHSEAFPRPISYWTKDNGDIVPQNDRTRSQVVENTNYKMTMRLTIANVNAADYGTYHCISKNTIGEAEATIKLYQILNTNITNEVPKNDSLFLGDGYYSSVARDRVNLFLLATTSLLLTPLTSGLSTYVL